MKLLDDKKRLFGIVNPIDAIVIVGLLVAAVVIGNVLFGNRAVTTLTGGRGNKTIEMVVLASQTRAYSPGDIVKDDKVSAEGGTGVMGSVTSVRAEPAVVEAQNVGLAPKLYKSALTQDVYITVRGIGDLTPDGAYVGDQQVRVNHDFNLLAPRWEGKSRIMSLRVVH